MEPIVLAVLLALVIIGTAVSSIPLFRWVAAKTLRYRMVKNLDKFFATQATEEDIALLDVYLYVQRLKLILDAHE